VQTNNKYKESWLVNLVFIISKREVGLGKVIEGSEGGEKSEVWVVLER
jgi:hypothetical protein